MSEELKNIYYINFIPSDTGDSDSQSKLKSLKDEVELDHQFMNAKGNDLIKDKTGSGQLNNDVVKKASYKAKVTNFLMSKSPWMEKNGAWHERKDFNTDKSQFHQELVTTFTQGLGLPSSITPKVEGLLGDMQQSIITADQSGSERRDLQFFIKINHFQWDKYLKSWRTYIRTIYLSYDDSLVTYVKNKDATTKANVSVMYEQCDYQFHDRLFQENAEEGLQRAVSEAGRVEGLSIDISY